MHTTRLPREGEYPEFYKPYISKLSNHDLLVSLDQVHQDSLALFGSFPEDHWEYRYEEGKWTIKELLGHLIDAERIFSTRALRFSRNDQTPLPGFEQNDYVPESNVGHRTVPDLLEEWSWLRKANIKMFANFSQEMLKREGMASGWPITVMALGFVMVGHEKHHQDVFQERYFGSNI